MRLDGYDYSLAGAYFLTMVCWGREEILGTVADGEMQCNDFGMMAAGVWEEMPNHFPQVDLGDFVVMPNHVHGIIIIDDTVGARRDDMVGARDDEMVGARHASPQRMIQRATQRAPMRVAKGAARGSLGAIVGAYKSAVAKRINEIRGTPGERVWQRNYFDHIIRDEKEWERINDYIQANPARWAEDEENPTRIKKR